MVPLPSECRDRKVTYPAPWGGKGGEASWGQGLPWGMIPFIFSLKIPERAGFRIYLVCSNIPLFYLMRKFQNAKHFKIGSDIAEKGDG
ncbi:MAG: hypothetical protein ISR78_03965 [Spirochaetia bacterium]|nr:hypothetical protein [Spirochaetia bacterium]